ncbi:hypothetical protein SCUP515_02220 [Seiridium cupressi]
MIDQYRRIASMPASRKREVRNLQNWVDGTACLDRGESSYLKCTDDLVDLAESGDTSISYTESAVEDCTFWLETLFAKFSPNIRIGRLHVTADDHVLLLGPTLQRISRAIAIMIVTLIILAPTIVLLSIESPTVRVVASIFSGAFFLSIISLFTRARTIEVFAAGASYAAVLVVFTATK